MKLIWIGHDDEKSIYGQAYEIIRKDFSDILFYEFINGFGEKDRAAVSLFVKKEDFVPGMRQSYSFAHFPRKPDLPEISLKSLIKKIRTRS